MPVPNTNVSMNAIATELQYGAAFADNSTQNVLFASSQLAYDNHGGSYHNLTLSAPGSPSFATSIGDRYIGGTGMGLQNWCGYNHDAEVLLGLLINNSSREDVDCRIEMNGTTIFSSIVPASNAGNINIPIINTGIPAFANFAPTTGYHITALMNVPLFPPAANPAMMTVMGVDTDNVGGGLVRLDYTNNGAPGGPWNLGLGGSNFGGDIISGDNGSPFPSDGISWNKRTTIIINITP